MTNSNRPEPRLTPGLYGFAWGPMSVTRVAENKGTVVLDINTDAGKRITIYVSPTGRSVRVFDVDGAEWKPLPSGDAE